MTDRELPVDGVDRSDRPIEQLHQEREQLTRDRAALVDQRERIVIERRERMRPPPRMPLPRSPIVRGRSYVPFSKDDPNLVIYGPGGVVVEDVEQAITKHEVEAAEILEAEMENLLPPHLKREVLDQVESELAEKDAAITEVAVAVEMAETAVLEAAIEAQESLETPPGEVMPVEPGP